MALSNEKMTAEEMLGRLRKRDRAEKVFLQMKSFMDSEKSYCHGTNTYVGRNFVLFFALIMRLSFRFFERQYFEKSTGDGTTATVLGYASKLMHIRPKAEHGRGNMP